MSSKFKQRLTAGVVTALCLSGGAYLLWQTNEASAGKPPAPVAIAENTTQSLASRDHAAHDTPQAGGHSAHETASALPVVANTKPANPRATKDTLDDAEVIAVRDVLPKLEAPVANWKEYTPELLTIALPGGRTLDFAMTSVREEHGNVIWNGRSDFNDASAFIATVATENTWFTSTIDPDTGENIIYYITGTEARRIIAAPKSLMCDVAAPSGVLQTAAASAQANDPTVMAASSYGVDVLFFYDQTALDRAGTAGGAYIQSRVLDWLENSNHALSVSGVDNLRWRFAGIYQTPAYDDGEDKDASGSLQVITSGQGAVGAFVAGRAEYHSADQIVMLFGTYDTTAGGMAICPGHHAAVHFASYMTYHTLAHELGHNFGCLHDRDEPKDGGTDGDGKYNYGHLFEVPGSGTYGTIMSYAGSDLYPGSRLIGFYSNPSVRYMDVPTGVIESDPRAANNARVLREEAAEMSRYRTPPDTKPFIVTHPRSGNYPTCTTITLSVVADMSQVSYQWKKGSKNIEGAIESTYSIDSAQESDAGRYSVKVSNIKGSVTSNEAIIGVGSNSGWGWGYGTGTASLGGDDVSTGGGGGAPGLYYLSALLMLVLFRIGMTKLPGCR